MFDGRHRRSADALLDRFAAGSPPTLVTVALGLLEALNALRRLERLGSLDAIAADAAVGDLNRLDLAFDPPDARVARIWSLRTTMTPYDAAYAAAAESLAAPLVTVDVRLLRACRAQGIAAEHLDDLAA